MIRLILYIALSSLSMPSFAQFLIKGGFTKATVNFQESYALTVSPISGPVLGVGYDLAISSPSLGVLMEGVFIQKGANDVYDTHGSARRRIETTAKIAYLEFPILLKYSIGRRGMQVYFDAGPSLAIALAGKFDTWQMYQDPYPAGPEIHSHLDGKIVFNKETTQLREMNVDNRVDVSCQLGAGLLLMHHLILDFRYGIGLSNLYDTNPNNNDSNPTSKHRVTQFSVGYKFGLKRN